MKHMAFVKIVAVAARLLRRREFGTNTDTPLAQSAISGPSLADLAIGLRGPSPRPVIGPPPRRPSKAERPAAPLSLSALDMAKRTLAIALILTAIITDRLDRFVITASSPHREKRLTPFVAEMATLIGALQCAMA